MSFAIPAACVNHPEREAMGICVRCRVRHCSECITKIDGVNFCAACVGRLARAGDEAKSAGVPVSPGKSRLRAVGYFVLATSLLWVMIEVIFPGRG